MEKEEEEEEGCKPLVVSPVGAHRAALSVGCCFPRTLGKGDSSSCHRHPQPQGSSSESLAATLQLCHDIPNQPPLPTSGPRFWFRFSASVFCFCPVVFASLANPRALCCCSSCSLFTSGRLSSFLYYSWKQATLLL